MNAIKHLRPRTRVTLPLWMIFIIFAAGCAFDKLRLSIDHGQVDVSNVATNAVKGLNVPHL